MIWRRLGSMFATWRARWRLYELDNREGREVRLDVTSNDGRLEDIMWMAVKIPDR